MKDSAGTDGQYPQSDKPPTQDEDAGRAVRKKTGPFGTRTGQLSVLIVVLLVGLATGYVVRGSSTTTVVASSPTVTVVRSAPAPSSVGSSNPIGASSASTDPSIPTPTGSAGALPGSVTATGTGTVGLNDLKPVAGAFANADTNPMLNGQSQAIVLTDVIGTLSNSCGITSNELDYNLGGHYTQLTAVVGVDDASPDQTVAPAVEVDGDGLRLGIFTPKLGHKVQVNLNVTGVLRLNIKWSVIGNGCSLRGYLIIADGQLATVPGYRPSASAS